MSFKETGEKESPFVLWDSANNKLDKTPLSKMDRANSFYGASSASKYPEPKEEKVHADIGEGAVAVVDPFSTGMHLAAAIVRSGVKCVRVLSIWDSPVASLVQEGVDCEFCATIQHNDQDPDENASTNAVRLYM